MLENVTRSHFLQMDGRASLPFMWPINIFSRISAIPHLEATLYHIFSTFINHFFLSLGKFKSLFQRNGGGDVAQWVER